MVATEDKVNASSRIGKIDFTIGISDSRSDRTTREEQVKALTSWLLAQWRLSREEGNN